MQNKIEHLKQLQGRRFVDADKLHTAIDALAFGVGSDIDNPEIMKDAR